MNKPHIGHVGIIVEDLSSAVETLTALLGVSPSRIKEIPDVGLKVAEFEMANIILELLQYTSDEANLAKDVMGRRLGLNHLSVTVSNMDEAVRSWTDKGLDLSQGFPREGSHGKVAFFNAEPTTSVLFEVCEPHQSGGNR